MKTCTKCGKSKPFDQFYKRNASPDGLTPRCKECLDRQLAAYREANPEKVKARKQADYRKRHPQVRRQGRDPQKAKACDDRYRAAHPERVGASQQAWQDRNPGVAAERSAAWYAANPEWAKQTSTAWTRANRERARANHARWRAANPHKIKLYAAMRRAAKTATIVPFTLAELLTKVAYWNDCCWVCGGSATAIDHVKPLAKGGAHMLCNLRPICKSCNSSKSDKWPVPSRAMIMGFAGG